MFEEHVGYGLVFIEVLLLPFWIVIFILNFSTSFGGEAILCRPPKELIALVVALADQAASLKT